MKVVFRVDASSLIGSGHLVRSLTLAACLREQGAQASFICRAHPGARLERIQRSGFSVVELPAPESLTAPDSADGYASWLGVPVAQDARDSMAALDGARPDWLVVDHYGLDRRWQQQLRAHVGRILVIDDLADRQHDCDLLLDQNHGAQQRMARYRQLAPAATMLLGPSYALLDANYRKHRECLIRDTGPVRRILVFLSAADTPGPVSVIVDALECLEQEMPVGSLQVDLVMNPDSMLWSRLQARLQARPGWHLHGLLPNLAGLLAKADLAIGAGGTTTWERLCLGVPSAAVVLADNQRSAINALAADGLLVPLGEADGLTVDAVFQSISALVADTGRRRQMAQAGTRLVDGMGALRVAAHMTAAESAPWRLERLPDSPDCAAAVLHRWRVLRAAIPVATVTATDAGGDDPSLELVWDGEPLLPAAMMQPAWPHVLQQLHQQLLHSRRWRLRHGELTREPADWLALASRDLPVDRPRTQALDIAVLSDADSWLNVHLPGLLSHWLLAGHRLAWAHQPAELPEGTICFYLGCSRIVDGEVLARFRHNLVVHESRLPAGRGWSPLSWQVLNGQDRIAVTLFEAGLELDAGPIHDQTELHLEGHELNGELKLAQFQATALLCRRFVDRYLHDLPPATPQQGEASYWPRRRPKDSELDPQRSLAEQFNLLRIVDNQRYPAWFDWQGQRYELAIRKHGKLRPGRGRW